ncbi:hypothetical protein BDDG_00992 [Blastomyces dermatitidis ATCC 18188]|uniref:DUF2293 domain-containing protein n=1 Tax=Ajellomyces dermatitidis (strain ATCC 18188 / CBS 674.68) TaxID=653446 RepID=F2T3Q3_AJEDA|nr:hypothetical protein BDDG_00992 [Blastomyces dermatitidis ATCC 18188]
MSLLFLRSWSSLRPAIRTPVSISNCSRSRSSSIREGRICCSRASGHDVLLSSFLWRPLTRTFSRQIIARSYSSTPSKQAPSATRNLNRHGETILVDGKLPRGYVFVPPGNKFMLRQCRRLMRTANDRRTIFVQQHRKPPNPAQPGIYVPHEIASQAAQDLAKLTAALDSTIWKKWAHEYPRMPAADKTQLQRLVSEKNGEAIANFSRHVAQSTLWGYVSRTYTSDEHLVLSAARDPEAVLRVRERIDGVLESWRG